MSLDARHHMTARLKPRFSGDRGQVVTLLGRDYLAEERYGGHWWQIRFRDGNARHAVNDNDIDEVWKE